jgi:hypothetical protein
LHDTSHHFTHFTGWMLEEEIGASLWGSTSSANWNRIRIPNIFVECLHAILGTEGILRGGRKENMFDSNSFRNRNFFAKVEL